MTSIIDYDFEFCDDDTRVELWNNGALDGCHGLKPALPNDPDYMDGYRDGRRSAQVRVATPARPEGYYHAPLGAFD